MNQTTNKTKRCSGSGASNVVVTPMPGTRTRLPTMDCEGGNSGTDQSVVAKSFSELSEGAMHVDVMGEWRRGFVN